jgi:hypothetical protein
MVEGAVPHVEVAAYVLGKLEPDEAIAFEAHLPGCAGCRRELAELQGIPGLLDQAVPAVVPPPQLRGRTLAAIRHAAAEPAARPEPGAGTVVPLRRRGTRRRLAVAVATAAALLLAVLVPTTLLSRQAGPTTVALVSPQGGPAHGEIEITPTEGGRLLEVAVEDLPPAREGSQYSLWAVGERDTEQAPDRVPIIQFTTSPDGTVHFQAFTPVPGDRFRRFDVTNEPLDNNPAKGGPTVLLSQPA